MVESKYVLYGALAGLSTGIVMSIVVVVESDFIYAIVKDLVGNNILRIDSVIRLALYVAPILYPIQFYIIGALFGVLEDLLIKRSF